MFSTSVTGGKAFAAKQKIRELKAGQQIKTNTPPTTIILQPAENMSNVKSEKYGITPNKIEQKSLSSEKFKTLFNIHRIERSKHASDRLDRYDQEKYAAKKRKLCENLNIGEKVLIFPKRIKKKSAPGKFYK